MTPRFTKPVAATGIFNDEAGRVAVRLLQREHAAMVEEVKSLMPRTTVGPHNYARKEVLKELLAWLNERGR